MFYSSENHLNKWLQTFIVILLFGWVGFISGQSFLQAREQPQIYPGPGVTKHSHLSNYLTNLKKTNADSDIYILDSGKPGGTILVLGGTHADEPAGNVTAVLLVEKAIPEQGRVIVIPQTNRSAFTHTPPLEAYPNRFEIDTPNGKRWFSFGARYANQIDQWPDPDIYVHYPSGQRLSGNETRNLNRSYPGRPNGVLVEKVAYAIRRLIKKEQVDLVIDLHESPLEYFFINAMAVTDKSRNVGMMTVFNLSAAGIQIGLEAPPVSLHGFSYRELADSTQALTFLAESANPIQGKLRGCTVADKIVSGKDPCYTAAARLGRTFVPFDETGLPLSLRVARHLTTVAELIKAYSQMTPGDEIVVNNIPTYDQIIDQGIGFFLAPPIKK
ncbi:MAG TPA: succinylglutamate desuccinylase/aspartoacylase family protein [Bacillota bacterium]